MGGSDREHRHSCGEALQAEESCHLARFVFGRGWFIRKVGHQARKPVGLIPFQNLNSFIGYLLQYFGNFYRELSSSHQSVSQPGKGFSQVRGSRWVIPARGLLKCF